MIVLVPMFGNELHKQLELENREVPQLVERCIEAVEARGRSTGYRYVRHHALLVYLHGIFIRPRYGGYLSQDWSKFTASCYYALS
jgi:hypothetical protein